MSMVIRLRHIWYTIFTYLKYNYYIRRYTCLILNRIHTYKNLKFDIVFSDTFEDCTKRKINCITMNLNALLIN